MYQFPPTTREHFDKLLNLLDLSYREADILLGHSAGTVSRYMKGTRPLPASAVYALDDKYHRVLAEAARTRRPYEKVLQSWLIPAIRARQGQPALPPATRIDEILADPTLPDLPL